MPAERFKPLTKVEDVRIADHFCNLCDFILSGFQQVLCLCHAQGREKLQDRGMIYLFKHAAHIRNRQVKLFRQICDA